MTLATCLEIRGFGRGETKNVIINNCILEQDAKNDETIWINTSAIPLENVIISNCIIKDYGDSNNMIYVGNSSSKAVVKNVSIIGNQIYKENITNRVISVGKFEGDDKSIVNCQNIIISNNLITVDKKTDTPQNYIITYGYYNDETNDQRELTISNNIVKTLNSEFQIQAIFEGKANCFNNTISGKSTACYMHINQVIGDKVDIVGSCCSYCKNSFISSVNVNASGYFFLETIFPQENVVLKDSKITCSNYLMEAHSNSLNGSYTIINNDITVGTEYLFNLYQCTGILEINLFNNNFNCNGIICNAKATLHMSNNTRNHVLVKGIPGYALDRESCTLGTILFSKNSGKSIVRKVSEGNAESNWEEI